MAKTGFCTVRQPGLSRLSLQDGPNWTGVCYHDIRAFTLSSDLLVLHHRQFLITLRGHNLRQLSWLRKSTKSLFTPAQSRQESAQCTHIAFQQLLQDD